MKLYKVLVVSLFAMISSAYAIKEGSRDIIQELFTIAGKEERNNQLGQAYELINSIDLDACVDEYAMALECIIRSYSVYTDLVIAEKAYEVLVRLSEVENVSEGRLKAAKWELYLRHHPSLRPQPNRNYRMVNISIGVRNTELPGKNGKNKK
jgi:hypothetical protein